MSKVQSAAAASGRGQRSQPRPSLTGIMEILDEENLLRIHTGGPGKAGAGTSGAGELATPWVA
jgi:hypothetical protein